MTYTVFLEVAPPDSPLSSLPSFDKDQVYIYVHIFVNILLIEPGFKLLVTNTFFLKSGCDAVFQIL